MLIFRAQQKAEGGQRRKVQNQVIRKGWLALHNVSMLKGSRDFWFVLTSETIMWFKDEEVKIYNNITVIIGGKVI